MLGNGFGWFDKRPSGAIDAGSTFRICGLHRGEYELTAYTDIHGQRIQPTVFVNLHFTIKDEDLEGVKIVPETKIRVPVAFAWADNTLTGKFRPRSNCFRYSVVGSRTRTT